MEKVLLEDETLRDGLQSEKKRFSLSEKIKLFEMLVAAGVKRIQVGSFVHPKVVPQMADTDDLIGRLDSPRDVLLTGLVLNERGLDRAEKSGLRHLSMSVSASDTHSRKNANKSASEALVDMSRLIEQAVSSGIRVRAGVQSAFGCVYEGGVSEDRVLHTLSAFAEAGAGEFNLADTTGMANPRQITRLVGKVKAVFPDRVISLHLHDTRGLGLVNMMAGYDAGVRIFDTATGGLGGCPFVKGAAGNVPTEDSVNLFERSGVETGIDLKKLCRVVETLSSLVDRKLPGRMCPVLQAAEVCDTA